MNDYQYHLIVSEDDVLAARQLAVDLAGGNPQHTFLVKLQDNQGSILYGADLMATEQLRQMMAQVSGVLPSLRWFRMDAQTSELQESTEEVQTGQRWNFNDSLETLGLNFSLES
jgi:predicted nucleic acid-binding protein